MENYFPEFTESFLAGQDILYQQFNDINFYVEDSGQEHFYFNIFKKIFPSLKFEKIFPLNGKDTVIANAKSNIGNKKNIYILDLDFDLILNKQEIIDNIFYLERYSIENYLISKEAIYEIIRTKNPKLKNQDIDLIFNYNDLIKLAKKCLSELICSFIVIQKFELGVDYHGLNTMRDFDFSTEPPSYRMNFISNYLNQVEYKLRNKDKRLSLRKQLANTKKYFKTISSFVANVPGKYLLNFIKDRLQHLGLIYQVSSETFTYNLSKEINPHDFGFLEMKVINYIK